ncbi:MAG: PEP-CTERM sorting domain-containing protein [Cyanobacteriota bacterium]|nr:PEP-CTERM sorting domain-containing protein [Cyanobacteriota bacterium]
MQAFLKNVHSSTIFGFTLFSALTLMPNSANAIEFYTMTDPCDLVLVDTDAGTQTIVGSLGLSVEAMAFNAAGELYASVQPGYCGVHSHATHLARINPLTADVEIVGAFGFGDVDAMAFRPDGTLFGVSAQTDELFEVDLVTGAGTSVGSVGFPFVGGIEFLSNSLLVGADMVGGGGGFGTFITLDQSTGAGTSVGPIGFNTIEGLTFGQDGVLYGISDTLGGGAGAIISIDLSTGAGTFVQSVASPRFRDALAARKLFPNPPSVPEPSSLFGIFGAVSLAALLCKRA